MGYYAKKSFTGGIRECDKADADYFVQTMTEHEDEVRTIRKAIADREDAIRETEEAKSEYLMMQMRETAYSSDVVRKAQEEWEKKEADLLAEISRLKSAIIKQHEKYKSLENDLERMKSLKNNLERISRERANAERNLVPKKTHSGYLVISSSQYFERIQEEDPNDNWKTVTVEKLVWKTSLQTPFDASLPLNEIEPEIKNDFMDEIFGPLGICRIRTDDLNGEYKKFKEEDENGSEHEVCGVYKWIFRANFRLGFWEAEIYHTLPIHVPNEFRLPKKTKKEKGKDER